MNDSTLSILCLSGAAVCAGIACLYWRAIRESARLAKLADADKTRLESVYAQIHRNTTSHVPVIEVKPRLIRVCPPTVKMMTERKEKP